MDKLDRLALAPVLSWGRDGLASLVLGLNVTLTGLIFLFALHARNSTIALICPLLWGASCLGSRWLLSSLKDRWVVPRRGYAVPRQSWEIVLPAIAASVLLSGLCIWAFHTQTVGLSALATQVSVMASLLVAAGAAFSSWRYQLVEFPCLAAASLAVGAWTYYAQAGLEGLPMLLFANGMVLSVLGAVRLQSFLRTKPDYGQS